MKYGSATSAGQETNIHRSPQLSTTAGTSAHSRVNVATFAKSERSEAGPQIRKLRCVQRNHHRPLLILCLEDYGYLLRVHTDLAQNIILRCALKTPKKRKMLYDMTEGANHLTPVKARKLNPSEEPEEPEEAKSGDEGQSPRENPQASHATGFRLRPPVRLGSLSPS